METWQFEERTSKIVYTNGFMNFIKNNLLKIVIVIIIALGIGWYLRSKNIAANPLIFNSKNDQLVTVKRQNVVEELTLAGSLDALSKANLQFQTSGRLSWVGVKIGDTVKKGQAVASLDKQQLEKQFQSTMNTYLTNRSTFEDTQSQYKPIKEQVLITDEMKRILDRTQYSLNNSVLNVEISNLALRYATLTSPIAGVVVNLDQPNAGVNVTPGSANFTIIDPTTVYFKAEIDQETVPKVTVGQKAIIHLDAFPEQSFESEITYISFVPVAGQTSTVYQVRFKLPINNENMAYRLAMDGDATLTLKQSDNTLAVPTDTINDDGLGNKYIFEKDSQNRLTKVSVKTGIETDTLTEIIEGLHESDQVVIKKR